jgi:predicted nucleotidyltransferase
MAIQIAVDKEKIADFCHRHHIVKLALFGSVLGDEFRSDSDVDVLVEYDDNHIPNLLKVVAQEEELSNVFKRRVDLRTAEDVSEYFRAEVIRSAQVQYGG